MSKQFNILDEFHWLMDVLQSIDVGLVVLNRQFEVELWNSFMQNHSALMPADVMGKPIFQMFPELPETWFRRKAQSVFELHNSAFTTWELRPYLFRFKNYRPVTGVAPHMYQNSTLVPLVDTQGQVNHICLIIYDVTDTAVNKAALTEANAELEKLSRTDRLTGLFNRGYWEECLRTEFKRFQRNPAAASLVMFDIDHFKPINDQYGHPTGDEVIRNTANIILQSVREVDIAGRYGGEEFVVLLVNSDEQGAGQFAERLRKKIEASQVHYEGNDIRYTVSLGVAALDAALTSPEAWLQAADQALYLAKNRGRNQWCSSRELPDT